jgi:hypothetical protein
MTTAAHLLGPALMPAGQLPPQSTADLTFDPKETCARCGPGTQAHSKWVFRQLSERTGEHCDLYLCAHCSQACEPRLLSASILRVDRPHHRH